MKREPPEAGSLEARPEPEFGPREEPTPTGGRGWRPEGHGRASDSVRELVCGRQGAENRPDHDQASDSAHDARHGCRADRSHLGNR